MFLVYVSTIIYDIETLDHDIFEIIEGFFFQCKILQMLSIYSDCCLGEIFKINHLGYSFVREVMATLGNYQIVEGIFIRQFLAAEEAILLAVTPCWVTQSKQQ